MIDEASIIAITANQILQESFPLDLQNLVLNSPDISNLSISKLRVMDFW